MQALQVDESDLEKIYEPGHISQYKNRILTDPESMSFDFSSGVFFLFKQ